MSVPTVKKIPRKFLLSSCMILLIFTVSSTSLAQDSPIEPQAWNGVNNISLNFNSYANDYSYTRLRTKIIEGVPVRNMYLTENGWDHMLAIDGAVSTTGGQDDSNGQTGKVNYEYFTDGDRGLAFFARGVTGEKDQARSELVLIWNQDRDVDYFSSFKMYVPVEVAIPPNKNIFWQYHQAGSDTNHQPLAPPLAFSMDNFGNYVFERNWIGGKRENSNGDIAYAPSMLFRDYLDRDTWKKYAVAYRSGLGATGYAEVIIDGSKRMVFEGETAFEYPHDERNGKTKVGIYRYGDPNDFANYYDEVHWRTIASQPYSASEWIPTNGVIGYWRFDELSSDGVARDSVDRRACQYVGDLRGEINSSAMRTSGGVFGGALDLDGVDDYVSVPASGIWDTGSAVTVSAWFQTNTEQSGKGLVTNDDGNYKYLLYLTNDSKSIIFYVRTTEEMVTATVTTDTFVHESDWYHVVGVYKMDDPECVKLYINGESVAPGNINCGYPIVEGGNGIKIGKLRNNYFKGKIDEVKIYNYALSEDEVCWIYRNKFVAYWRFDDDGDRVARDSSENKNTAVLINGTDWDSGIIGDGVRFDGIDDHIQSYADDQIWNVTSKVTVSTWFKTTSRQNYTGLVSRDDYNDYKYMLYLTNDSKTLNFYVRTKSGVKSAGITVPNIALPYIGDDGFADGEWHYVVGVFDAHEAADQRVKLYVDGQLVDAREGYFETILKGYYEYGDGIQIGHWKDNYFEGVIDDVAILRSAMTADEVAHVWTSDTKDVFDALYQNMPSCNP